VRKDARVGFNALGCFFCKIEITSMAVQPARPTATNCMGVNPSLLPPLSTEVPSGTLKPDPASPVKLILPFQVTFASMILAFK
jgi:hypothetical protein